jgi:hypothetical protein
VKCFGRKFRGDGRRKKDDDDDEKFSRRVICSGVREGERFLKFVF